MGMRKSEDVHRERKGKWDAESQIAGPLAVFRRTAACAAFKVLPYGLQILASAAAYTVGISTAQVVGYCLRVSCATPLLGPALGAAGVGFASTLAGHASFHMQKLCRQGGNPLNPGWWEPLNSDEAFLDALIGLTVFKAMGGKFRSIMPSDLAQPGALAFESIPARSDEYAQNSVKRELARIFRRDGCHHCGSQRGPVIADHMPPNKLVHGKSKARAIAKGSSKLQGWLADQPLLTKLREIAGAPAAGARQRFFPQCQRCSLRQSVALRNNRRVLVLHFHAPRRAEHLAGVFVGLRRNSPPLGHLPPARGGGAPRWQALSMTALLAGDEAPGALDPAHSPSALLPTIVAKAPGAPPQRLAGRPDQGAASEEGAVLTASLDGWVGSGAQAGGGGGAAALAASAPPAVHARGMSRRAGIPTLMDAPATQEAGLEAAKRSPSAYGRHRLGSLASG